MLIADVLKLQEVKFYSTSAVFLWINGDLLPQMEYYWES